MWLSQLVKWYDYLSHTGFIIVENHVIIRFNHLLKNTITTLTRFKLKIRYLYLSVAIRRKPLGRPLITS